MSESAPLTPQGSSQPTSSLFSSANALRVLQSLGLISGCALLALGIISFVTISLNIKAIVNAIYQILFGILIILCEFKVKRVLNWFAFLTTYTGVGFFYGFVGLSALGGAWYEQIIAIALMSVGLIYLFLGCMCKQRMAMKPADVAALMAKQYAMQERGSSRGPAAMPSSSSSSSPSSSQHGMTGDAFVLITDQQRHNQHQRSSSTNQIDDPFMSDENW